MIEFMAIKVDSLGVCFGFVSSVSGLTMNQDQFYPKWSTLTFVLLLRHLQLHFHFRTPGCRSYPLHKLFHNSQSKSMTCNSHFSFKSSDHYRSMTSRHTQDHGTISRLIVEPPAHYGTPHRLGIYLSSRSDDFDPGYARISRIIAEPGPSTSIKIPRQYAPSTYSLPRDIGVQPKTKGDFLDVFVCGIASFCLGTCLWIPLSACVGCATKCCTVERPASPEEREWIMALKHEIVSGKLTDLSCIWSDLQKWLEAASEISSSFINVQLWDDI